MTNLWTGFRQLLDVVTTVVVLTVGVAFLWTNVWRDSPRTAARNTAVPPPAEPVSLDGAPAIGSPKAKFAMMEFADYQCPYCARFAKEILPEIRRRYVDTGRVMFVFRHHPLTEIHPRAHAAAEASECAARQGYFWQFHDRLFDSPQKLGDADLLSYAGLAGLNVGLFRACLADDAAARVEQDSQLAQALKLSGTPAFLLGRIEADGRVRVSEVLAGVKPLADFVAALEKMLTTGDDT